MSTLAHASLYRRNTDPIISAIEKRVALWTQLPVSHQEDMQVRLELDFCMCACAEEEPNACVNKGVFLRAGPTKQACLKLRN
eukprot:1141602-Pelagomonas_calceolata.AAC.2